MKDYWSFEKWDERKGDQCEYKRKWKSVEKRQCQLRKLENLLLKIRKKEIERGDVKEKSWCLQEKGKDDDYYEGYIYDEEVGEE